MKLFHRQQGVDWRIDYFDRMWTGPSIIELTQDAPVEVIEFDQICRHEFFRPITTRRECCWCCDGERYFYADISKPGIVLRTDRNPLPMPYRLLDGQHRIWAMQAKGWTEGPFKVVTLDLLKPYLNVFLQR